MLIKSLLDPWKSFFGEIDTALEEEVPLHCLGGFVMSFLYGLERPTADVDILPVGSISAIETLTRLAGQGSELHKKYKIYVQVVGVAQVPVNYENRLVESFLKPSIIFVCLRLTRTILHFPRSSAIRKRIERM